MTVEQLAVATRSDRVWLNNSRRLLGRRLHRTPSGARWWAMVRMLNHEVGLTLKAAARVADTVLEAGFQSSRLRFAAATDNSAALQLDLERFHSTANACLSAAFAFSRPGTRGRPPRVRRAPTVASAPTLRIRVENEPEKLDRLATHLRGRGARLRGIEPGLAFILDATTLRAVPRLALTTSEGEVDVLVVPDRTVERSALHEPPRGR